MTTFLRAASLTNFEQIATEYGLNAVALIEEAGLSPRCLKEPDLRLPAAAVGELLELAAQRANEPALGLRLAASRRLSNLGPLGLLLRDQPTLRHALETLVTYMHTHAEALSISLVETGDFVNIREEPLIESGNLFAQAVEMAMGSTFRVLGIFLGDNWKPRVVRLKHPKPNNIEWHLKIFGNQIEFGHEFNEIVCNAGDLAAPNLSADPVMAQYSQRLLEREVGINAKMSERVRRLIVLLLPRGHCKVEVIAQHLGVSRRTITNHLAAEGVTFKKLVNDMRSELLAKYLQSNAKSLTQIAPLLGFSELSAFSRWHKDLYAENASEVRTKIMDVK